MGLSIFTKVELEYLEETFALDHPDDLVAAKRLKSIRNALSSDSLVGCRSASFMLAEGLSWCDPIEAKGLVIDLLESGYVKKASGIESDFTDGWGSHFSFSNAPEGWSPNPPTFPNQKKGIR